MAGYKNDAFESKKFDIIGNDEFVGKVKILFDALWKLEGKIGEEFIRELDGTPHKIGIKKGNNTTSVSGEGQYYKLIAAFRQSQWAEARVQLQSALSKSFYKTPAMLAKQLAVPTPGIVNYGFSPAQIDELAKDGIVFGAPKQAPLMAPSGLVQKDFKAKLLTSVEKQWETALTKFLNGGECVLKAQEQYTLVARKLESWLTAGPGVPAVIGVDLDKDEVFCAFDGTKGKRPVAIGFAHELVHAYYSVTGTRLYEFEKIHDEALTTGLPPEHFRKYSENRFRVAWPDEKLGLRLFYMNQDQHRICAFCGFTNVKDLNAQDVISGRKKVHPALLQAFKSDPNGPKWRDVTHCERCGKSLPRQKDLEGKLVAPGL